MVGFGLTRIAVRAKVARADFFGRFQFRAAPEGHLLLKVVRRASWKSLGFSAGALSSSKKTHPGRPKVGFQFSSAPEGMRKRGVSAI